MKKSLLFSFLSLLVLSTGAQVALQNHYVAYYPFNASVDDESGYHRDGSATDVLPTADRFGMAESANTFNGNTSRVNVSSSAFAGMNDYTLSAWFRTSAEKNQIIISKHNGGFAGEWYIGTTDAGSVRFTRLNTNDDRLDLDVDYDYADDEWHHLVAVFDGSTAFLYLDNELIGSDNLGGNTQNTSHNVVIGGYAGADTWRWDGAIDEVYVFNKSLNEDEINALYVAGHLQTGDPENAAYCAGDELQLPFSVESGQYPAGTALTTQISDASGDFGNAILSDAVEGPFSEGTSAVININTEELFGEQYRFRVIATNPLVIPNNTSATDVAVNNPIGELKTTSALRLHYPLDGNAQNEVSDNYHGSANGVQYEEDRFGMPEGSFFFDGNASVNIGDYNTLNRLTVSAWIKTSELQSGMIVSKHYQTNSGEWYLATLNDGTLRFTHINSGNNRADCQEEFDYADGKWHHIAGVYDGSELRLYVDGELISTKAQSGNTDNTSRDLMIGAYSYNDGWNFTGHIDDVKIHDQALSDDEVKVLKNNSLAFNNGPICVGTTLELGSPELNDVAYTWDGPDGFSAASADTVLEDISLDAFGAYTLTLTRNGCSTEYTTEVIQRDDIQADLEISANTPLCEQDTLLLQANTIEDVTYEWNGPEGFSTNTQNAELVAVQATNSGEYTLRIYSGTCADEQSVQVEVNKKPATPEISSTSEVCAGETVSLTTTAEDVHFNWSGPAGFHVNEQNPIIAEEVSRIHAGTYTLSVEKNGCASDTATVELTVNDPLEGAVYTDSLLTAHYQLDGTPENSMSTHHHGTASGSVTFTADRFAQTEKALLLEGNNHIVIQDHANLKGLTELTASAWFKTIDDGSQMLVSKHVAQSNGEWYLALVGGDRVRIAHVNSSEQRVNCDGEFDYADGQWHHAAGVYDGNELQVWVDGKMLATVPQTGTTRSTGHNMLIGDYEGTDDWAYNGVIDDVNLHARALTSTEVRYLANNKQLAFNNGPVCEEDKLNVFTVELPGATYDWTGPSDFISDHHTTTFEQAALSHAGAYNLTVNRNECVHLATTDVTVDEQFDEVVADSPLEVCEEDSVYLSATVINDAHYSWSGPGDFTSEAVNPSFLAQDNSFDGDYSLEVARGACYDSAVIALTVHALPETPVISYDEEMDILVSSWDQEGNQWLYEGEELSGETDVTHSPAEDGAYKVVVTTEYGCRDTSDHYMYEGVVTGLNETEAAEFSLYPNPVTDGKITVSFEGKQINGEIRLTGADGMVYYRKAGVLSGTKTIDTASMSSGMYVITIISEAGKDAYPVMIQ